MPANESTTEARRRRSTLWVVALSTAALVFDGYDLVVYGTIVPTLLGDPSQLGPMSPAQAGTLGSYALIGVLVGALVAGAVGDRIGRRRIMLVNLAWFSIGMAATALAPTVGTFALFRFLTGIGVGALVATVGALVAEFAPPERRNRLNAVVYSGIPAGGVLASLLALTAGDAVGWRGLLWIGALPLVTLLPLALVRLPESPRWLASRGRLAEAAAVAARTGVTLEVAPVLGAAAPGAVATAPVRFGFAALVRRPLVWPTALLGTMSFAGLLLTYGLNTWLPQIMTDNGYGKSSSLAFLLVLNLGAISGGLLASWFADRMGAKRVIAVTFVLAAISLALLPAQLPLAVLLLGVAVAGVGTIGTQVLVYGLVANYYPTRARAAGVAWCAGFGRLGGIVGPVLGGVLVGAGLGGTTAFFLFAGIALLGALVTGLVPRARQRDVEPVPAPVVGTPAAAMVGATVTT
ncbi:MFS transporter [Geodermatophilus sabuli]|uniref:MFS transporter, AAHS family, benzoate transport protein n=1 Tax=Geodermatophilus sabuli TaxID=1564158 RepID=A0A285EA30_9ACTN|nr:aromatic acid/H+ symport family MFS transporter [Geodermatophilus sabuli]MBB3082054.1 AAHS family benzoate transporter-like MFS transporter [Geodermatophilus sabuli]SNX95074.1 MFS transporter, AAHS family, benzoate transport protein [Geodermatophilus sabuli]